MLFNCDVPIIHLLCVWRHFAGYRKIRKTRKFMNRHEQSSLRRMLMINNYWSRLCKFYLLFNKIKKMYSPFSISVVLLGYFIVFGGFWSFCCSLHKTKNDQIAQKDNRNQERWVHFLYFIEKKVKFYFVERFYSTLF